MAHVCTFLVSHVLNLIPTQMGTASGEPSKVFSIVEAEIKDLRYALDQGWTTSVDLVRRYVQRIAQYDRRGKLNSIPLLNESVFEDAAASDDRRARGVLLGPLEGIPFTVKDSYMVKGMTVASGSPAFKDLIASDDAFTVKKLRDSGAVLIGKTNMPPMAAGGMQRGVYGRAESPYNAEYLTAGFASGSSNGSATSTSASFASFGMAEETVSSGRSPASNNGLVAYTPSRGMISIRGNWPLYPTCDVIVPHTRTMGDMLEILDVVIVKDNNTIGDFWRDQPFIPLPGPSAIRPSSFKSLEGLTSLQGKRFAVPNMYIGNSEELNCPITIRPSILDLWRDARRRLESLGAVVVETAFPLMALHDTVSANYPDPQRIDRGYNQGYNETSVKDGLTKTWNAIERRELLAYAWDDFLRNNNHPSLKSLANVDASLIFPSPPGSLPDRYSRLGAPIPYSDLVSLITDDRPRIMDLPGLEAALTGLERRRKVDFEDWLEREGFDAVVFPANADVGRADADVNESAADNAWKNGVMYSNGNRVLRHYGIPTVTMPMGIMEDTQMPVGLTFAGKAYSDVELLGFGYAFEGGGCGRKAPVGTPVLESDLIEKVRLCDEGDDRGQSPSIEIESKSLTTSGGRTMLRLSGKVRASNGGDIKSLNVYVNGVQVDVLLQGDQWTTESILSMLEVAENGLEINKTIAVVSALGGNGRMAAKLLLI